MSKFRVIDHGKGEKLVYGFGPPYFHFELIPETDDERELGKRVAAAITEEWWEMFMRRKGKR